MSDNKKNKSGIIVMVCNIAIMIANYIIHLVSNDSETIVSFISNVADVIC